MRRLAIVVAVGICGHAHADERTADLPVRVSARLHGAAATLTASFDVPFERGMKESALTIALPSAASVIAGRATVAGERHALRLVDADAATANLEAARSGAPSAQRVWSFAVQAETMGLVAVDIIAPRAGTAHLELELEVPTCFAHDARHVRIPPSWEEVLDVSAKRTEVASSEDLDSACGGSDDDSSETWFALPAPVRPTGPTPDSRIVAGAGRLALSSEHVVRAEFDLARRLSVIPADLRTVIVVDASRSLSPAQLDAQRAIVAAYLRVAPRGRVQVVAYARRATALLSAWAPAASAAPAVDEALRTLALRNGSNVDAGVTLATSWLRRTSGTLRMLVFSDELLSEGQASAIGALAQRVPAKTIVHTIALDGAGSLERYDSARLAPLAAATTGIPVSGGVDEDGHVDATLLARPISIDHLALDARGWTQMAGISSTCHDDRSLPEGSSCLWWGEGTPSSDRITVRGLLWNRPFTRTIEPDVAQSRMLARVLSAIGIFSDDAQREVDRLAQAVNSVWSLYISWGGTGGYGDIPEEGGGAWSSSCGCSRCGTIGHGSGTGTAIPASSELHDQLAAVVATCRQASSDAIDVSVETTLEEIVGVDTSAVGALRACIVEGIWNLPLHLNKPASYAKTAFTFRE